MAAENTSRAGRSEKGGEGEKKCNLWKHLCIRCADSRAVCLYSNRVHWHTVHQLSRCSLSDVSDAPWVSLLIPGEHVRWNSPPIKTGISWVYCGNLLSVGTQRVCPSLLPSPTLSLILTHSCSLSRLPPVFLTSTVTVPPLQSSTLTLSSFSTAVWSTPSLSSIYEILLSLSSL